MNFKFTLKLIVESNNMKKNTGCSIYKKKVTGYFLKLYQFKNILIGMALLELVSVTTFKNLNYYSQILLIKGFGHPVNINPQQFS